MKIEDLISRSEYIHTIEHEASSFDGMGGDWEKFAEGMKYAIDLAIMAQGVEIAATKPAPKRTILTNGDYIRAMSDHELAEYLAHFFYRGDGETICYGSCGCGECKDEIDCIVAFTNWLKKQKKPAD